MGRSDAMEIEHFRPGSRPEFKHLEKAWPNLYYSCRLCNGHKGCRWPTEEEERHGLRFVDPCAEDPEDHFRLCRHSQHGDLCRVTSSTAAGQYTIERIGLNREQLIQIRRDIAHQERCALEHLNRIQQVSSALSMEMQGRDSSRESAGIRENLRQLCDDASKKLEEIRSLRPFPVDEVSE